MNFELLFAFIIYAIVSAITPGPNNMMVLASGLNYGFSRTIPHIAGIVCGFGFLVFLAGIGLLSLLDYVPFFYHVLHVASIVYLLYLAFKIATARPIGANEGSNARPMTFMQAVAFQWVNPKALVMATAAITTYIPEDESAFFMNVVLVSFIYALITLPCVGIWAVFGNSFRKFLKNPLYYRIFNITMAVLLVLSLYPLLSDFLIKP